jgi:ABC-type sugar transport system permease subunit
MKNKNNYGYFFIAPFVIVFLIFGLYPIVKTLYFTFTNFKGYGAYEFVGFYNWIRMFNDKFFFEAFYNTWRIWGLSIVIQLGLAMVLVVVFSDALWKIRGLNSFRIVFYLPNLITLASVAMLFRIFLDWKYGALNQLLIKYGIIDTAVNWLDNPNTAQAWVSIIMAWLWFGNSFVILIAGMKGIPEDVFEAARIDGANRWGIFRNITIPLLKPILLFVLITALIGGMQIFELPLLITDGYGSPNGSLNTMVLYLYNQAFKYRNFAYASTIAYGIFLVTVLFSFIAFRILYKQKKSY